MWLNVERTKGGPDGFVALASERKIYMAFKAFSKAFLNFIHPSCG